MSQHNKPSESNLTVRRAPHTENFTVVPDRLWDEERLSDRARFVAQVILMFSQSGEVDKINPEGIAVVIGKSIDTTRKYLRELEDFGWLRRTRLKDERGKYTGYQYELLEEEITKELT